MWVILEKEVLRKIPQHKLAWQPNQQQNQTRMQGESDV